MYLFLKLLLWNVAVYVDIYTQHNDSRDYTDSIFIVL
jgi:hypothetical protein